MSSSTTPASRCPPASSTSPKSSGRRRSTVNLKSCFSYIQAVAPTTLECEYGRIVSRSSLNAHSGGVTTAVSRFAYAAAKVGMLGKTRALAKEHPAKVPGEIREITLGALTGYDQTEQAAALPSREHDIAGIPGQIPSLIDPPAGCRYHPRCPLARALRHARPGSIVHDCVRVARSRASAAPPNSRP